MKYGKKWMACSLAFILSLSGCSSQNSSSLTESTAETETAVQETAGPPVRGGELNLCVTIQPNALGYPGEMSSTYDFLVSSPAVETLGRIDEEGNVCGWLVKSWDADPEKYTYTLHLQEGVTFHDGTPFDAEAVKYNLETTLAAKGVKFSVQLEFVVQDAHTLIVQMDGWNSTLMNDLLVNYGCIVSPAYLKSVDQDTAVKNPVGTGPFRFVEWKQEELVRYQKNSDYWGGEPYLDEMTIYLFSDPSTAISAIQTGEVDGVMFADSTVTEALINQEGVVKTSRNVAAGCSSWGLFWSADEGLPTADVRVRQALSYAIDSKKIADAFSNVGYVYTNQFGAVSSWGYNEEVTGYEYNPEKAKELLAEAGYADGFTYTAYVNAGSKVAVTVMELVQAYLSMVGVDLEIKQIDMAKQTEMIFGAGWDGVIASGVNGTPENSLNFLRRMFGGDEKCMLNCSLVDIPDVVELGDQALVAKTEEEKRQLAREMQTYIVDEACAFTPLMTSHSNAFTTEKVHDSYLGYYYSQFWCPEEVWVSK